MSRWRLPAGLTEDELLRGYSRAPRSRANAARPRIGRALLDEADLDVAPPDGSRRRARTRANARERATTATQGAA